MAKQDIIPMSKNNYNCIVCRVNDDAGDIGGIEENIFGTNEINSSIDNFLNSKKCSSNY